MNNLLSNLTTLQRNLLLAILAIVLYAASTGVSYAVFSATGLRSSEEYAGVPTATKAVEEDPSAPRTESCPLNGALHTKEARDSWELRRPLAVMIENHIEARPQSGLTSADIVYEAVAEGGITRFMALFLCNLSDIQVGPVRSARTYFIDWASPYDPLYAHVGGANTPGPANALGQVIDYDIKSLNQFGIGFPTYWRDYQRLGRAVATEHTMYSTTQKLWAIGEKKGWTVISKNVTVKGGKKVETEGPRWDAKFTAWKSKEDEPKAEKTNIGVNFWQNYGDYKRKNGGSDHMDLNNNKQLSPKVVIVQFQRESRANDGYEGNVHLIYGTKGRGKVLVFQDGKVAEGVWVKESRLAREKFLDSKGSEILLNKGQIWIQTIPEGSNVSY